MTAALPPAASLRRRLASLLYECLLVLGVLAVTFMAPHLAIGVIFAKVLPGYLLLTHVIAVLGLYFIWYWSHGGQTLAMQTWKLRITAADGTPPNMFRLSGRYLLAWFSLGFWGAGLIWALLDRDGQFLHDRLAGTRIVRCA